MSRRRKCRETEPAAAGASASEAAGASAPSLEIHEQQQETADEQFPPSPTRPSTPTLEAGLFTPAVSPVQITQETEETPRNLLLSLPPIPGSESGPSPYGYGYGTPVGAPEPQARRVLQFGEAGAARDPKDEEISRLQQELKRSERAIENLEQQQVSWTRGHQLVIRQQNKDLHGVITAFENDLTMCEVKVVELTQQIAAQACAYQRQQATMQVVREQQQHSHAEIERLTIRERALQEEVKNVERLYNAQNQDWNGLLALNAQLKDLSDARNLELQRLSVDNGQYLQENTSLRVQLEALEARNAELQNQNLQMHEALESSSRVYERDEQEIAELRQQLAQSQQLRGRNMALQRQVDELQDLLAASEQHRADLGADAARLNRLHTSVVWQHEMQIARQGEARDQRGPQQQSLRRFGQWGLLFLDPVLNHMARLLARLPVFLRSSSMRMQVQAEDIGIWVLSLLVLVFAIAIIMTPNPGRERPLQTSIDCSLHPVQCFAYFFLPFRVQ